MKSALVPSLIAVVIAVAGCAAWIAAPQSSEPLAPRDAEPALERIDFNREVRPLLSDRCFACHGPDEAKRKADLRLDTPEGGREVFAGGVDSEAARRITSDDVHEVMPPPKLKRPLSDAERATLLRWIEQGAQYEPHWAFVPPRKQAPPRVKREEWPRDELDAFVLAELERLGLEPEPEAEPRVLLRRASLVLTGLPPTPEDADAFAAAPTDENYRRAVREMLASPRAAEHMASTWLDLARYADTYGFQTDAEFFAWPWRDWLLNALASNMRYDEFVTAIIAGDLKPNASVADRVATGFNRLHRMTEEGGSTAEEFRQEAIADRVSTFGTTFLGLTVECARCHDHKYDPLPTREFYALGAMFGSLDENGLKPYSLHVSAPPPYVRLSNAEQDARTAELLAAVERAKVDLAVRTAHVREHVGLHRSVPSSKLVDPVADYPFEQLENGLTPNRALDGKPASTDRHRPDQLGAVALAEGRVGRALSFDGDGGVWLDGLSNFGRFDEASIAVWIRPGERNARAAIVHAAGFYTQDADASGLEFELEDGRVRWSAIHLWPGSAASVRTRAELPVGEWTHLVVTYDGSSSAAGLRVYVNGQSAELEVVRDTLDGPLAAHTLEVGSRSRGSGFRNGQLDELRVWRTALTAREVRRVACADGVDTPCDGSAFEFGEHLVERVDEGVSEARKALREAQRALAAHLDSIPTFVCMQDSSHARPTYVLTRGAYDQPDLAQPVEPGALESVLPFDADLPRNRTGLARWLLDPRHPLTARVAVNRLWAQVFGRGLVETNENFGVQGASPSHPALLDALAHDFASGEHAWDVRRMLERLVTSATFRQSSATSARKRELDPDNASLSRGPSTRMGAEMLRDCALAASGLLIEKLGGPSVKPWQPEGLWAQAGQGGEYKPDSGDNAHRRSLYTFRKRTVPPPNLEAFDAGSRESCQPRRGATNTPLQSLVLFNDPTFVECARELAKRTASEAHTLEQRIERAFRRVCTRAPTLEERAALVELAAHAIERYRAAPQDAQALCGAEDAELAALTLVCLTVLSSDGALVVR